MERATPNRAAISATGIGNGDICCLEQGADGLYLFGEASGSPVDFYYTPPFPFTGQLRKSHCRTEVNSAPQ